MNILMNYYYISLFAERMLNKRNNNSVEKKSLRTEESKKQNKAA